MKCSKWRSHQCILNVHVSTKFLEFDIQAMLKKRSQNKPTHYSQFINNIKYQIFKIMLGLPWHMLKPNCTKLKTWYQYGSHQTSKLPFKKCIHYPHIIYSFHHQMLHVFSKRNIPLFIIINNPNLLITKASKHVNGFF